MKPYFPFIGLLFLFSNCIQPDSDKIITGEIYYPEENVTLHYEMNQDSILHGNASWTDSTNRVYLEEVYVNGKSTRKLFKEYHENGQISVETEYVKDKEINRRNYSPGGTLIFQCPLNTAKIGKLRYIINDGKRDYLIKDKEDTIEIVAENLPERNQILSSFGAILSKTKKGYIIKSSKQNGNVRLYIECRTNCDVPDKRALLDSLFIPVK